MTHWPKTEHTNKKHRNNNCNKWTTTQADIPRFPRNAGGYELLHGPRIEKARSHAHDPHGIELSPVPLNVHWNVSWTPEDDRAWYTGDANVNIVPWSSLFAPFASFVCQCPRTSPSMDEPGRKRDWHQPLTVRTANTGTHTHTHIEARSEHATPKHEHWSWGNTSCAESLRRSPLPETAARPLKKACSAQASLQPHKRAPTQHLPLNSCPRRADRRRPPMATNIHIRAVCAFWL